MLGSYKKEKKKLNFRTNSKIKDATGSKEGNKKLTELLVEQRTCVNSRKKTVGLLKSKYDKTQLLIHPSILKTKAERERKKLLSD